MNNVHVLIEGYAHPGPNDSFIACCSVILIETSDKKILVDPGTNKEKLLKALKKKDLTTDDIDMIFLSHYHPDHWMNVRLFPEVDLYDGEVQWHDDEEYFHKDTLPGTDIKIVPTPGHSAEQASLLVETEDGVVSISQDVFWWEDGKQDTSNEEALLQLKDPFASDVDALRKSRKLILKKAEWIIPGHGKMFKNPLY